MTSTKHKITAISLAFLILISTTGIGLNTMFCSCTGQQYLAFLATTINLNCCKGTLGKAVVKENCCLSSTGIKKQQSNFELPSMMAKGDCCSSSFKYAKASINFELSEEITLPTSSPIAYHWVYTPRYEQPFLIPQKVTYNQLSNKAPPRFKESILNWFQIYRC